MSRIWLSFEMVCLYLAMAGIFGIAIGSMLAEVVG
jgi:hypothetical protein